MRKHFLLLFLMALLPLAGWAQVDISGVTPTIDKDSYAYNGNQPVITMTVKSPSTLETIATTNYDLVYYNADGQEITNADVLNVATYYVAAKAKANTDYTGTTKKVQFTITPRPLTISFEQVTETYGFQNVANYGGDVAKIKYTIKDDQGTDDANDDVTYDPFNTTQATATAGQAFVSALGLTVSRTGVNEVYDVAYATNNSVTGYAFTFTYTDQNYNLTRAANNNTDFRINPKQLADTDVANITYTAGTHVYTGNKQAGTFTVASTSDITFDVAWYSDASLTTAVASPSQVGDYYAKLTGKGNYSGSLSYSSTATDGKQNWKFNITRRAVTISIIGNSKVYDGENINLTTADIAYSSIQPVDAQAMITDFAGQVILAFGDDATDHKAVKRDANGDVISYDLVLKAGDNFTTTSLYKNYGFEDANGDVQAIAYDNTSKVITGITGAYTINPRPIEFKANTVKTTFGVAPAVPAVSIGSASTPADVTGAAAKSVLYVAPEEGVEDEGIVEGDLAQFLVTDFKLTLATKAKDANDTEYAWTVAPANLYEGAITLAVGDGTGNPASVSATSLNYEITYTAGNVRVGGQVLKVSVQSRSIQYGDEVTNDSFTYLTNPAGKTLTGDIKYEIYEITDQNEKGAKKESWENLPVNVYLVEMVQTGVGAPANYELGEFEPGYLIVDKKQLTINVPQLTLNVNDSEETLNAYISPKTYDTGINDETISFVYSFNTTATTGAVTTTTNAGVTTVTSDAGTYPNGITGALIDDENDDNYLAANKYYDVNFTYGGLKLVAAATLVLNQQDPNLNAKIEAAAAANANYTIEFASRELKAGNWYTMVLPFDVKTADLVASLRAVDNPDADPLQYHHVYAIVNRFSKASTAEHISFTLEMNEIPANEPFMIKVAEDLDLANAKFDATRITYSATPQVTSDEDNNQFIGVYTATSIQADQSVNYVPAWYDSADQQKWRVPGSAAKTVDPMEAYLVYSPTKIWGNNAPVITFEDLNENGTTSIVTFNADTKSFVAVDGWYTLNGVKLQGVPTEKGIYINNGKKIVIK